MKDFAEAKKQGLEYSKKEIYLDRHNNALEDCHLYDPIRFAGFMAGCEWLDNHLNRTVEVKEG